MPKAEPSIEFEIKGLKSLEDNFKRAPEYMYGAILTALRRIGKVMVPAVKSQTPVGATSKLRNSTVFQVMGKGREMKLEVRQSAFSDTGFPYGVAVRLGTKPHFPPIEALIPWVKKKLGIGDEKEARTVAFLVARKISKVGTKGNPYHERVLRNQLGMIRRVINEEMVNLTKRFTR